MNTNPKSFRLTKQAQENLQKQAEFFGISESKIINLLLTEQSEKLANQSVAERVLRLHFINKAEAKHQE